MRYLLLLLAGCVDLVEVPVQINPFICIDGFKWELDGTPIVNDVGAQEECTLQGDV